MQQLRAIPNAAIWVDTRKNATTVSACPLPTSPIQRAKPQIEERSELPRLHGHIFPVIGSPGPDETTKQELSDA